MTEAKRVTTMLEAAAAGDIRRALALSAAMLAEHDDCPYLLVFHSVMIRMQDGARLSHTLEEAEQALLRAHSIDRSYLPALEELAHYYDAVTPVPEKARAFASQYIEKSEKVLDEMRAIMHESG